MAYIISHVPYSIPELNCETCQEPATVAWGSSFGTDHLSCDAHSPLAAITVALPSGFYCRTLGMPGFVPHTTGHLGVASGY